MKLVKQIMTGTLVVTAAISSMAVPGHSEPADRFVAGQSIVMPQDTGKMSEKVKAFKKEWNKKLDKLDAKIAKEEKKLKRKKEAGKEKLNEEINDMKAKRDDLQQEINEAGDKTAAQWDDFKDDVSRQYQALNQKVKDFFRGND